MAVRRQIIINSRNVHNEEITTTISNINPDSDVTTAQLYNMASQLNKLTTNTFTGAYVVNTELLEAGNNE